ncbi:DUF3558 domain-containing protein [Amycolatopsis rubida]|uniref:DUF3558 domain-containing protein n=1 Tax=Amycolatopsis rubida TaxID=112413 RepID=A0A1I5EL65_9PSEU|nr:MULTISPECIES: DUF3558 domain-containing protein [Amycolatopsis]MYW97122.1 DUF3558 domain-containing protein [Amycolatopsis rubida]NEC62107.1 DUF3558 domain-containing protein [Amycolatopsis rubida]OAP27343.1 hypothetical protein A4R44_02153 [Amycolatopsis sp. M39]SFO12255.1 Protein of unknown function [Amycolatopsis rubida]
MNLRTPIVLLSSAALLTACSGTTAGHPTPVASSSSLPGNEVPPYGGAPKVEAPLPDSVLSGSACDALSPQQIRQDIGEGVTGKPEDGALGPKCTWSDHQGGSMLTIFYTTKQREGLSIIYKQVKPQMKRFDVLPPIQGFPAVAYDPKPGPRTDGCQVAVGLSDTLEFEVGLDLGLSNSGKADACDLAAEVTGDVITTLKKKAGR